MRSSLEEKAWERLQKDKGRRKIKLSYESETLKYSIPSVERKYLPDFVIEFKDGHKRYIEMKGYFRPEDRRKMRLVKERNPELDIRLVFPSNNKVSKTMRYSDWCEKYGFIYSISPFVPKHWLKRNG